MTPAMLRAIGEGLRGACRSFGLVPLLVVVNLGCAALLAVTLERDLAHTNAAQGMMFGFDIPWWSPWLHAQTGWTGADPLILGLGVAYLVVQAFLAGGVFATLRGPQGSWTVRGLLHGCGFYFGRFLRLALVVLLLDFVLFRLNAPLARWADHEAREAVSEATARMWLLGRHGVLLLAILWVNMVSGYAKAVVVLEQRSSAVLAFLSALSFAVTRPLRAFGHYLAFAAMGVALLAFWHLLVGHGQMAGWATPLVTLALAQCLVGGGIALRLALWAGQLDLYRRLAHAPGDARAVV